jgi:proline iminopeptidase
VIFDQRNCGRSTPGAADLTTTLTFNTTQHLVADMEKLRRYLRIDKWVIFGGSWGVTLGLAYAEHHPERVTAAVFASVTMTRPADVHWLYHEVGGTTRKSGTGFGAAFPRARAMATLWLRTTGCSTCKPI